MTETIFFLIALGLGTGILIVSMVLTSGAMGSVEFGAVHVVIAKSLLLLILVDLVALVPTAGIFLTIPVWWLGLMLLFKIDFWECRTLVLINWMLNVVLHLLLRGLMMTQSADPTRDLPL